MLTSLDVNRLRSAIGKALLETNRLDSAKVQAVLDELMEPLEQAIDKIMGDGRLGEITTSQ